MTTVTNKNGIEFDIDAIATDLNNKVDLDGTNATYPHVVSRTPNSQGGIVEIWSDGYCVQTGEASGVQENTYFKITLPQAYKNEYAFKWVGMAINDQAEANFYIKAKYSTTNNALYYFIYQNGSVTTNNPNIRFRAEGYIR